MVFRQMTYYGVQALRYCAMASGAALVVDGFLDGNYDNVIMGCCGFTSSALLLTKEGTKRVLKIEDTSTLDDRV